MKKYSIWLLKVFGYANPILSEMFGRFETAEGIFKAFESNIAAAGSEYAEKAAETNLEECERMVDQLEKKGISIINYNDPLYPEALKGLSNPPCALFAKGNTSLLSGKLVTIGGSRKITDYTIAAESRICGDLCRKYTLVASLTDGCEQLACLTAIKYGAGCIEIMPCGFDCEYPKGSRVMREQLLMNGGCVVTEFLPEIKSNNANFIRRARIAGAISKAMIIFQAGASSGSFNAAKYSPALFFLPPHDVFSADYAGAVIGVRMGASLYYKESDIEQVFSDSFTGVTIEIKPEKIHTTKEKKTEKSEKENKKVPAESNEPSEELFETSLHYSVFMILKNAGKPVTFDEIYSKVDTDISQLSEILLDLEIDSKIKAIPGSRYEIC